MPLPPPSPFHQEFPELRIIHWAHSYGNRAQFHLGLLVFGCYFDYSLLICVTSIVIQYDYISANATKIRNLIFATNSPLIPTCI
jgi:hypothetical protein